MDRPLLAYSRQAPVPQRRWTLFGAAVAVVVAAIISVWFAAVFPKRYRSLPPARETEELTESFGLAVALATFAHGNGGNYPARLEELAAMGAFDSGRRLGVVDDPKDGRLVVYQIGYLQVQYRGGGHKLTKSREAVIARGVSLARPGQVYDIWSDASCSYGMRLQVDGD